MSLADRVIRPQSRKQCQIQELMTALPDAEADGLVWWIKESGRSDTYVAERINTDPDVIAAAGPININYQSIGRHRRRECQACRVAGKEFS